MKTGVVVSIFAAVIMLIGLLLTPKPWLEKGALNRTSDDISAVQKDVRGIQQQMLVYQTQITVLQKDVTHIKDDVNETKELFKEYIKDRR